VERFFKLEKRLQAQIGVHDLRTYRVRIHAGSVEVDLPTAASTDDS